MIERGETRNINRNDRPAKIKKVRDIFEQEGCKRTLQFLRNPSSSSKCKSDTVHLFKGVFESEDSGDNDTAPFTKKDTQHDPHLIHRPIGAGEVQAQLKNLPKKTAPGPDLIKVEAIAKLDPKDLACLFNIFLLHSDVPTCLKINRTTMIPKCADPQPGDYRPITVASVVDRLFAKILEARLSKCVDLDASQKGFMRSVDGCGENTTTYMAVLRHAKAEAKELAITSVDLAKAFDSIKHHTIRRGLTRMGLDARTIDLLMNLCSGQVTQIDYDEGKAEVRLKKGVRQGWPLSPVLFLIVIDELLTELKPMNGFHYKLHSEEHVLTARAFADDIILYSSSSHGMRNQVQVLVNWCNLHGLRVNPKKSTCLYFRKTPRERQIVRSKLLISIEGTPIPQVTDTFERILGVNILHTGKRNHKEDEFMKDLSLVVESQLRPSQKLAMIRECLVPMIKFRLVYGIAPIGVLQRIDRSLRTVIKGKILHLPKWTANEVLHSPCRNGGMGIPKLETVVPAEQARLGLRMRLSSSPLSKALATSGPLSKLVLRYLNDRDEAALSHLSDIKKRQTELAERRFASFNNTRQGNGWSLFKGAPRRFVDDPRSRKWKEKDAIDALWMRANLCTTRESLACAGVPRSQDELRCRGCGIGVETLGHIVGACPRTHAERCARHNYVVKHLYKILHRLKGQTNSPITRVEMEYEVELGPRVIEGRNRANLQRPDLAVFTNTKVILIEVSVVYEYDKNTEEDSLSRVRREKYLKYRDRAARAITRDTGLCCKVRTCIVGARGGWLNSNNAIFKDFGARLSPLDKNAIVEKAVRGSLIAYKNFIRATRIPVTN